MGKKRNVSEKEIAATSRIEKLCTEQGIKVTDTYAVAKEIKENSGVIIYAFTRWAKKDEKRVLVVLSADQKSIKVVEDPKEKYASIRTVEPELVKKAA